MRTIRQPGQVPPWRRARSSGLLERVKHLLRREFVHAHCRCRAPDADLHIVALSGSTEHEPGCSLLGELIALLIRFEMICRNPAGVVSLTR